MFTIHIPLPEKGSFTVLDGTDGTGKTTTGKALAKALNARYEQTLYDPFYSVRSHMDSGRFSPLTRYFFYRAANMQRSDYFKSLIERGINVVCDRYYYSTYAGCAAMEGAVIPGFDMSGFLEPDVPVLLTAPTSVRRERLNRREQRKPGSLSIWEKDDAYQDRSQLLFQNMGMFEIDTSVYTVSQSVDLIQHKLNTSRLTKSGLYL